MPHASMYRRPSNLPVVIGLTSILVGGVSCADGSSPAGVPPAGPPARLRIVDGDLQRGVQLRELPDPLRVRVTDVDGRPVAGQVVNFRVVAGGGSVFAGAAVTDADGRAAERWTLGPASADTQRVEVRAVHPVSGQPIVYATFRAIADSAPPAPPTGAGGLRLAPAFRVLGVGGTAALQPADVEGNAIPAGRVQLTSRNPAVAAVAGLTVTGAGQGTTDVVAVVDATTDSVRLAVVAPAGFALLVSQAPDRVRSTATAGSTLSLDVHVVRPPGATGEVGALAGSVRWDAARLTLQSAQPVESGWSWTPNPSAGVLSFAAFSSQGTTGSFTLARLTFTVAGTASSAPAAITPVITSAGTPAGQSLTAQAVAVPGVVVVQ